jgi:TDG/mug DNA glycosylase family protein
METLPDYLQPGLDIVLVGLNPSIPSAQTGHYFANPRNRFWPAFNGAEMTPEPLTAETDYRVMEFGIGMTDIVKRPTPGVADLKTGDFRGGALDLKERLLPCAPLIVCLHGTMAATSYNKHVENDRTQVVLGPQPWSIGTSKVFVVPNPSPANASFSLDDIIDWYLKLKEFRDNLKSA